MIHGPYKIIHLWEEGLENKLEENGGNENMTFGDTKNFS